MRQPAHTVKMPTNPENINPFSELHVPKPPPPADMGSPFIGRWKPWESAIFTLLFFVVMFVSGAFAACFVIANNLVEICQ